MGKRNVLMVRAGKTLLAKAIASNIDANFLKVVSSAIVDKYIGESARLIREMFGYARCTHLPPPLLPAKHVLPNADCLRRCLCEYTTSSADLSNHSSSELSKNHPQATK